jgi:hypothetical protein
MWLLTLETPHDLVPIDVRYKFDGIYKSKVGAFLRRQYKTALLERGREW